MRAYTVTDGEIDNVAVFADGSELPDGWTEAKGGEQAGWVYNGEKYAPVEVEAPTISATDRRDMALAALVHDFGDGRVIQCRPVPFIDESNMRNAIERMGRTGDKSCDWYAADDTKVSITPAELQTVIESGQDKARVIWDEFMSETGA